MAKDFCLLKEDVDKIVKDIVSGKLTSADLTEVSTKDRTELLAKYVGTLASKVNLEIEHKMSGANAESAIIDFIREQTGLNEQRKLFYEKKYKEKINKLFDPKNETAFLEDAVEDILGVSVSVEEATVLKQLTDEAIQAKESAENVRIKDIRDMYKEIASVDTSKLPPKEAAAVASLQEKLNESRLEEVEAATQVKIDRLQNRITEIETGATSEKTQTEKKVKDPRVVELENKIKSLLEEQKKEEEVHKRLVKIQERIDDIRLGVLRQKEQNKPRVEDPRIIAKKSELEQLKKEKKEDEATIRKVLKLQEEIRDLTINGLKVRDKAIQAKETNPEIIKLKIEKKDLRDKLKQSKNTQLRIDRLIKRKEDIQSGVEKVVTPRPEETNPEIIELKKEIKLLQSQDYSKRYRKLIGKLLGEGNIPVEVEMMIKETAASKDKLKYATAIQNLNNFMEETKNGQIFDKFKSAEAFIEYLKNRGLYVVSDATFGFADQAMRAFRATLDLSFIGTQGAINTILNPRITGRNIGSSLAAGLRQVKRSFGDSKSNTELDALMIDFYMRDNFINGTYDKAGFDITKTKSETHGNLELQDIPGIGQVTSRIFKPFDVAFEVFMARQKMDVFDSLLQEIGGEFTKEQLKDYNRIASTLTLRSSPRQMGGSETVAAALLWSPSMMVSAWNLLTVHTFGLGLKTKAARVKALKQTLAGVGFYVGTIAALGAMSGPDDDWYVNSDPTSSDYGKLIIGGRRISILPLISGYIVLMSRVASGRYTTTTGKTASLGGVYDNLFNNDELPLGTYGTENIGSVIWRFIRYKFSPLISVGLSAFNIKTGFEDSQDEYSLGARIIRGAAPLSTVAIYDNFQTEESQAMQTFVSIMEILGKYGQYYE